MTLEAAMKAFFLADSGLRELIDGRFYPENAVPQKNASWPVLTYKQTGSDPTHYLTGGRSKVERDTFDIAARGPVLIECAAVRDYLRDMLSGAAARGTWGGGGGVVVRGCLWKDVFADEANPIDGSERRERSVRGILTVIWQRG